MINRWRVVFSFVGAVFACAALQCRGDMLLRYAFDDGFGDSGPSNNTGAATGNASIISNLTQSIVGRGSLSLDGADSSYVTLASPIVFANGAAWSVAFWAQRGETKDGHGMVIGRNQTTADFIWLNDNFTGLRFRSSTGTYVDFITTRDLNVHHYALATGGDGKLSLYVDGSLATNTTAANTSFYIDTVGQAYTTNSLHYGFKGLLDDVRVYSQALDAASVSNLYSLRRPLQIHYAFDGDLADSGTIGVGLATNGGVAFATNRSQVMVGSGALTFDGGDTSYASLATPVTFTNGTTWSVAFWAQRGETGAEKGMVLGSQANSNDFIWLNDQFSGFRFRSSNGLTFDANTPKDRNRHHYALIAPGNGTMTLYVDGQQTTNATLSNNSFTIDALGQAYPTNAYHYNFSGVLDDVWICGYALDGSAVTNLYKQGQTTLLHYTFDGTFKDASASGNNGTASGTATLTADTNQVPVGTGALLLDAAGSSYVALSNAIAFAAGSPWSIAFWAKRGETGNSKGMIIGTRTNTTDFIWLNDSYTGLRFRSSNGTTVDFTAPKNLNLHHYALVANASGALALYLDGALASTASAGNTSFLIDSIGKAYTGTAYDYSGLLDDVRVYAYALDAASVASLFAQSTLSATTNTTTAPTATRVRVYLIGGQSNADGRAITTNLPTSPVNLQNPQTNIDFYYGGALTTLRPATSSGTQFGPEITFGQRLSTLLKSDATNRVALIKYAVGGTSLYSGWKANGNATTNDEGTYYINFQQAVSNGWKALTAAYPAATFSLEGMIWMQGESDVPSASAAYFANLTNFIADVRITYGNARLPFVIGRLSASQTGAGSASLLAVVRQAQTDAAAADPWAGLVDTDGFPLKSDALHFDDAGQRALGIAFAEQLLYLRRLDGLFTDVQLAAGAAKPDADPDGDGVSNWNETIAGTDPSRRDSVFAMTNAPALAADGLCVVRWPSAAGRVYALERSTNLLSGTFTAVATDLPAVPPINVYTDAVPDSPSLFYRIRASRP